MDGERRSGDGALTARGGGIGSVTEAGAWSGAGASVADMSLAEREAEWGAAVLSGDWDAMAVLAREPLPVDAPAEARERWAGRRDAIAAADSGDDAGDGARD